MRVTAEDVDNLLDVDFPMEVNIYLNTESFSEDERLLVFHAIAEEGLGYDFWNQDTSLEFVSHQDDVSYIKTIILEVLSACRNTPNVDEE